MQCMRPAKHVMLWCVRLEELSRPCRGLLKLIDSIAAMFWPFYVSWRGVHEQGGLPFTFALRAPCIRMMTPLGLLRACMPLTLVPSVKTVHAANSLLPSTLYTCSCDPIPAQNRNTPSLH